MNSLVNLREYVVVTSVGIATYFYFRSMRSISVQTLPEGGREENRELASITECELAKHDTEDSCWIAIHGGVYDVTAFMHGHPGGKVCKLYLVRTFECLFIQGSKMIITTTPNIFVRC